MTIRARCPHCDSALAFPEAEEGRERECPACRGGLRVPPLIYYYCLTCHHPYRSSVHHAERTFRCRQCRDRVTVPAQSIRPHPAAAAEDPHMVGAFGQHGSRDDFSQSEASESDALGDSTFDEWFEEEEDGGAGEAVPAAAIPQFDQSAVVTSQSPGRSSAVYAGFFRRLGAWMIDMVIVGALLFIGGFVLGFLGGVVSNREATMVALGLLGDLLGMLFTLLYFTKMESSHRQGTFGKALLGMVVTDANGRRLGYGRALLRYLAKILSAITCGIGFLMIGFTREKQGLHDIIAGTYVEIAE